MKHLLDVNVLLAYLVSNHPHNRQVTTWLKGKNIVLCPLTETGFLRVSTAPRPFAFPMALARKSLENFIEERGAEWIPDDLHALESHPNTAAQVADHYLADLAARHGMNLATLDAGIKHPSVELIPARLDD